LQGCACNDAALLFYLSAIDMAREKDLNVIGQNVYSNAEIPDAVLEQLA